MELTELTVPIGVNSMSREELIDHQSKQGVGAVVYEPEGFTFPVFDFNKKSVLQEQPELEGVHEPYTLEEINGILSKGGLSDGAKE